jgi:hypothetical protein
MTNMELKSQMKQYDMVSSFAGLGPKSDSAGKAQKHLYK